MVCGILPETCVQVTRGAGMPSAEHAILSEELYSASNIGSITGTAADQSLKGLKGYAVKMCMGMGFPVGMAIPWVSHGNGNEKQSSVGMGMGMIFVGVGLLENVS